MSQSTQFEMAFRYSGPEIVSLMRSHKCTVRQLRDRTGLTLRTIRGIRERGVNGYSALDMVEAITGSLTPRMKAALMQARGE